MAIKIRDKKGLVWTKNVTSECYTPDPSCIKADHINTKRLFGKKLSTWVEDFYKTLEKYSIISENIYMDIIDVLICREDNLISISVQRRLYKDCLLLDDDVPFEEDADEVIDFIADTIYDMIFNHAEYCAGAEHE